LTLLIIAAICLFLPIPFGYAELYNPWLGCGDEWQPVNPAFRIHNSTGELLFMVDHAGLIYLNGTVTTLGNVITGGITGGNLNGTLLNGNTLSELFTNATLGGSAYQPGNIGWSDLGNQTLTNAWSGQNSFSANVNITGQIDTNLGIMGAADEVLTVVGNASVSTNLRVGTCIYFSGAGTAGARICAG